jgi:hypothetical protein
MPRIEYANLSFVSRTATIQPWKLRQQVGFLSCSTAVATLQAGGDVFLM